MKERAVQFRESLQEMIRGNVLEIGPGQVAFPTPMASSTTLVDKLPSDLHKKLFPELGPDVFIVEPDFLVDLDQQGLSDFNGSQFDVVIASHMLEHLAQPFRMLDDIFRVLKDEGIAVIFLPDRTRTFDMERGCPSFEHFRTEYDLNSREVSDEDLYDYMSKVENYQFRERNVDFVQLHLARSIHVHAWTDIEFVNLLNYMQNHAKFKFEIISGVSSSDKFELEEFGIVLRKTNKKIISNLTEQWTAVIGVSKISKINPVKRILQRLNPLRRFFRFTSFKWSSSVLKL
jgi:SAM-dependent methyltransferase